MKFSSKEFYLWLKFTNKKLIIAGLIYIVDSTDHSRMAEASEELYKIVSNDFMKNVPLLVFANKQDLPQASDVTTIVDKLQIKSLKLNNWHVQGCSAVTGEGLIEGFQKLSQMLQENKTKNYRNVVLWKRYTDAYFEL